MPAASAHPPASNTHAHTPTRAAHLPAPLARPTLFPQSTSCPRRRALLTLQHAYARQSASAGREHRIAKPSAAHSMLWPLLHARDWESITWRGQYLVSHYAANSIAHRTFTFASTPTSANRTFAQKGVWRMTPDFYIKASK